MFVIISLAGAGLGVAALVVVAVATMTMKREDKGAGSRVAPRTPWIAFTRRLMGLHVIDDEAEHRTDAPSKAPTLRGTR